MEAIKEKRVMKLSDEFIKHCLDDFHYELTKEQLEDDSWEFDEQPYYKEKDCYTLHNSNGCWIEIPSRFIATPDVLKGRERCIDLMQSFCCTNICANRDFCFDEKRKMCAFRDTIRKIVENSFEK